MIRDNKNYRLIVKGLILFFSAIMAGIFWASFAQGQDDPTITIDDFTRGGLNTNNNPFSKDYVGFQEFSNWDIKKSGLFARNGLLVVSDSLERVFTSDTAITRLRLILTNIFPHHGSITWYMNVNLNPDVTHGTNTPYSSFGDLGVYILEDDTISGPVDSVRLISSYGAADVFTAQVDPADTAGFSIGDSLWLRVDTTLIRNAVDTGRITGVYAYYDRNGRKFLMTVVPSLNTSASNEANLWYDLMISEEGNYNPRQRLRKYIQRGVTPVWTTYHNNVILAIPGQRALKFDGKTARTLTPRAPGQVEVTPVPNKGVTGGGDSLYFLDGTYRWAVLLVDPEDTGTSRNKSYVTPEFEINNGRAVIYDMFGEALDSMDVLTQAFTTSSGFSQLRRKSVVKFQLLRTRGRPKGLGPDNDTLFFVQEFTIGIDTLGQWRHVDSLPDSLLTILDGGSDTAFFPIAMDSSKFQEYVPSADSTQDTTGLWYQTFNNVIGAPQLIRQMHNNDTIYFGSVDPASKDTVMWWDTTGFPDLAGAAFDSFYEIKATTPWVPEVLADKDDHKDSTWVATGYFVSLIDPKTGEESDSGVNLVVPHKIANAGGADDSVITGIVLGLPPGILADTVLQLKLYRYMIYYGFVADTTVIVHDTVVKQLGSIDDELIGTGERVEQPSVFSGGTSRSFTLDTFLVPRSQRISFYELQTTLPYPVTIITDPLQSIFVDTFTWNELWGADQTIRTTVVDTGGGLDTSFSAVSGNAPSRPWFVPSPLPPINGVTVYADRLMPWSGSRLFTSVLDTIGLFRPFNSVAFNLDDGDQITWAEVSDNRIHVYKNFSYFILYDPVSGLPTKTAQVKGIGCVAPQSYKQNAGRAIYLSAEGLIVEQTAEFKDYRVTTGMVSEPINNLLIQGRPMSQLKSARAVIWDNKYLLSFPETDTTFVYFLKEPIPTWSIWSFSFYQGTGYDNLEVAGLVRSNEVIIALDTDERIFKLGGSYIPFDIGRSSDVDSASVNARLQTRPLFTDPNLWQIQQIGLNAYTGTKFSSAFPHLGRLSISVLGKRNAFQDSIQFQYSTDNYKLRAFGPHATQFPSLLIQVGDTSLDSLGLQSLHIWGRMVGRPIVK